MKKLFFFASLLLVIAHTECYSGRDYCQDECRYRSAEHWRQETEKSIGESDKLMENIYKRYCPEETPAFLYEYQKEHEAEIKNRTREFMQKYIEQHEGGVRCDWENQTLILDIKALNELEWQLRNFGLICYLNTLDRPMSAKDMPHLEKVQNQLKKITQYKKLWMQNYQAAIDQQCKPVVRTFKR